MFFSTNTYGQSGETPTFPTEESQSHAGKCWWSILQTLICNETQNPFVPSASGIRFLCIMYRRKLRDRSIITWRGGYKLGKSRVRNLLRPPPPSGQGKTFCSPLLKSGNFLCPPPFNMAKTSNYCVKTTPKLVVPPLQHG